MSGLAQLIRHDKPLQTGASSIYPYKPMLERKYRFTSRYDDDVSLCKVENDIIHLPRALCPVSDNDQRVWGEVVNFPKQVTGRPNQTKVFEDTIAFLKLGQSGIVAAYTGWGKTVLGYACAQAIGRKTLVITTKEDIYEQWIAGAKTFLGLKDSEIGEIRGDKAEVVGTKFVVALVQSLSRPFKYPPWIGQDFGLVIFDEVHRMAADQFSAVVWMFPGALRLGLSATVDRADGKELLLFAHIGPIRAATEAELMIPRVLRFHSGWECPRVMRADKDTGAKKVIRLPHQAGKTTHVEKIIAVDEKRNQLLADMVVSAYKKGRQTIFFSTIHDHLHAMHKAFIKAGIKSGDMGYYIGSTTKTEKEAREKAKVKPVVLTTFAMMSEGTNLPWFDTEVLGMPRSNVKQAVGRIRREYPDKKPPVVMDLMDMDSPVFAGYAATRLGWYKSIGCEVVEMS